MDSPRPSAENFLPYIEKKIVSAPGRGRSKGGFSAPERRNSTGGSSAEGRGSSTSVMEGAGLFFNIVIMAWLISTETGKTINKDLVM